MNMRKRKAFAPLTKIPPETSSGGTRELRMREAYFFLPCFEPSVAQPPLPLQVFLPLQPPSPVLQPPLPLQSFWPLQECLSPAAFSSASTPALLAEVLPEVVVVVVAAAREPVSRPARAAPASIVLVERFIIGLGF